VFGSLSGTTRLDAIRTGLLTPRPERGRDTIRLLDLEVAEQTSRLGQAVSPLALRLGQAVRCRLHRTARGDRTCTGALSCVAR
jgi:hypothetical protein